MNPYLYFLYVLSIVIFHNSINSMRLRWRIILRSPRKKYSHSRIVFDLSFLFIIFLFMCVWFLYLYRIFIKDGVVFGLVEWAVSAGVGLLIMLFDFAKLIPVGKLFLKKGDS